MKVIVTRPPGQAEPLASRLREQGHEVVLCPLIRIEPLGDDAIEVAGYDWVVVTSANAARELVRRAAGPLPKVAAIGPGTARAFEDASVRIALVPEVSTQEGLVDVFPRPPGRVLFAAAEGARRHLVEALGADFVPLYRTVALRPAEPPAGELVVLASPSAARAWAELRLATPAISIGPETTRAARDAGIPVVREARTHDLDGLLSAVAGAQ